MSALDTRTAAPAGAPAIRDHAGAAVAPPPPAPTPAPALAPAPPGRPAAAVPSGVVHAVFLISGVSALLYQLIWQRALLTIYGSNIESVTVVVSAFLIGLGLGSFAGGWLSKRPERPLLLIFALVEAGIASYGAVSLDLFAWVGATTAGGDTLATGLWSFALVLVPTLLMGSTLPLLVAHQVSELGSVGRSVSWLYFVNTLGAAAGSFVASLAILGALGLRGSVRLAVGLNLFVAAAMLVAWARSRRGRA
jgi:predicted membrane-bound spermidine synthase